MPPIKIPLFLQMLWLVFLDSKFIAHDSSFDSCYVLIAQLFLTLCDSMDCSPPGSAVHGISQARILEWAVTSFSRGSS